MQGSDALLMMSDEHVCTSSCDTEEDHEHDEHETLSDTQRPKKYLDVAFQSWQSGLYTDVTVIVGTQRFATHRLVLASLSDYFPPLLRLDEKKSGEVTLYNMEPDDFFILLNYAYTGEVDITKGNVQSVLIAADYLSVDHVKKMCIKFMSVHLDIDDVCDVLKFGVGYPLSELVDNAKQFLKEHLDDVSKTDSFSLLDPEFLENFFADDNLVLYSHEVSLKSEEREILILNSVLRYLSKRSTSDRNIVEMMIRTVRLTHIRMSMVMKCLMNFTTFINNDIINKYIRLREVAMKYLRERKYFPQTTSTNIEAQEIPDSWLHSRKLATFLFHQSSTQYAAGCQIANCSNPPDHLYNDCNMKIKRIDIWLTRWDNKVVIGGLSITYSNVSDDDDDDNRNPVYRRGHCPGNQGQNFVELEPDEFITKVIVGSGFLIDRLGFETNRGRTLGPFGGPGGSEYEEKAPPGPLSYLFDIVCDSVHTQGSEAIFNLGLRWISFS